MDAEAGERYARYFPYLESTLEIEIVDDRVRAVGFSDDPDPAATDEHELLDRIDRYLSGTVEDAFADIAVDLDAPADERAVLEAVRALPFGENATVDDIARATEAYDAATDEDLDTVREILDRNPVPLIIPDHRVRDGPSAAPPRVEQRLRSLEQLVS